MDSKYAEITAKIMVDRSLLKNEELVFTLTIPKTKPPDPSSSEDNCLEQISPRKEFVASTYELVISSPRPVELSLSKMPSIGSGLSVLQHGYDDNRCSCCPYGYHIDVDFVPFSAKMLSREVRRDTGEVARLQALNDKWRTERQSMDKLLGISDARMLSPLDGSESYQSAKSSWISQLKSVSEIESIHRSPKQQATSLSSTSYEDILGNGLSEAVTDFEEALSRTRPEARYLSYSIPDSQKFHTFPRIKPASKESQDTTALGLMSGALTHSNFLSNKGSTTSTSASTVIMKEGSTSLKDTKAGSESSLHSNADSIYNHSFQPNGHKREDQSDKRIEYLEDQVKIIPELEVKLTLLKEEKRQLMKLLDNEKQKCAKLEERLTSAKKEEDKTIFKSPIAPPRRKTRDAGVGRTVLTRDVGITHTMPRTRSVGVGVCMDAIIIGPIGMSQLLDRSTRSDSSSPTGSFSGTIRRRVRSFDVGIQVKEHDLEVGDPLKVLQIVEKVDCGVQVTSIDEVDKTLPKPRVLTKNASILAKPKTGDIGCTIKPPSKDIGVATKVDRRDIGVTAQLSEPAAAPPEKSLVFLKKPSKTLGVNTEQLKQKTTGTNTVAVSESSPRPEYLSKLTITTRSPLRHAPDSGGEGLPVEKASPKDHKLDITVTSSVSAPVVSLTATSPVTTTEGKSLSKIPRLTSPTSPKLPAKRLESPIDERNSSEESLTRTSPTPMSSGLPLISGLRKPVFQRMDTFTKEIHFPVSRFPTSQLEPLEEEDKERPSTSGSFASLSQEPREKAAPSKEMQGALKVLNDALLRGRTTTQVTSAISVILHEWFRVAGTKTANPLDVEDYLDFFESYSPQLLRYIVNMPDGNGNTAMHYAVSHGNFDVVSILLDSKVCDPNKANKAGYTSVMLVSLAKILTETHRQVVRRLFSLGDVNIKAAQHGQTALMLGASHGRLDTVKLLIEAGADVNIQDEDGSTSLMCAAEHGHGDIVKFLLSQAECDPNITDNDGSTALSVAMEAGHKDIGVMLYAHMHFLKGPGQSSTAAILAKRSRSTTPSSHNSESPASSSHTSPIVAKRQQSSIN
ncbi:KN motif and ankyrin repeat domain-containing protein 1 [Orchesella cincta]|uniref:KN motif and ankyrin repeat domain-containing protein 1 n=1 Tax=Orchesella cincta TaxID=48709 RepID=A0A1D2N5H3_ORCCI|nr:KN motif and ankyrin repeat domain-containing protein 1 [Orchesella cincta]